MSEPVIILKREPGPVAGMSLVTVDGPNLTQAQVVIDERLKDTQEEQITIRKMLDLRAEAAEAAKWGQL